MLKETYLTKKKKKHMKKSTIWLCLFITLLSVLGIVYVSNYHNPFFDDSSDSILSPPPSNIDEGITPDINTPEGKAVFIARLQEGLNTMITVHNVQLSTLNGETLWKVEVTRGRNNDPNFDKWYVYVNPKTWISKKNKETSGRYEGETSWRSFNELKAVYVADFYADHNTYIKRPYTIFIDGKKTWKVPVYYIENRDTNKLGKLEHYIYFDPVTGKSKTDNDNWKTLRELDEISSVYENSGKPYKNILRNIYPE